MTFNNGTLDRFYNICVTNGYLPESITAIRSTIKAPEKIPTLNVIHGESCSPRGGTLKRFIARCLSPCSKSRVTNASVSAISLSISLCV